MFGFGKKKQTKSTEKSDFAEKMIALLNCPCEHFPKGTDSQKVLNAYDDAFAKREMGGYTPMIIVPDELLIECIEDDAKTAEELKVNHDELMKTPPIDVNKWFTDRLTEWKNEPDIDWNETFGEVKAENGDVQKTFSGFLDYKNSRLADECILAKIPVKEPWEVFAWLPFGGWNDCPNPEDILRIAEYFYKRYGAIPAVMTRDVLEFSVPPLKDKDTAIGAALEQFAFCQDIVFQGVGTIGRLAGGLMQSTVWYFWWD